MTRYIFGSIVKGNYTEGESDIDLCIVYKDIDEAVGDPLSYFWSKDIDYSGTFWVEPFSLKSEDFQNPYNSIATEIKKHGIEINLDTLEPAEVPVPG